MSDENYVEHMGSPATLTGVVGSPRAKAFVQSQMEPVPAPGEHLPDILYHYTSADSLIKIFESKRLWATSIRHLNDETEYVHTLGLLNESMPDRSADAWPLCRYLADNARFLRDRLSVSPCYVTSFSGDGNLLSQWRAYSPSGNGFSIGLARERLKSHTLQIPAPDGQQWRLAQCVYEEGSKLDILCELIEEAMGAYNELSVADRNVCEGALSNADLRGERVPNEPAPLTSIVSAYLAGVSEVAPLFKDAAFKEEVEWRVVSPLFRRPSNAEEFRAGRYSIIPYTAFELPHQNARTIIDRINIGPTANPDLALDSVRRLAQRHSVAVIDYQKSEIPFRHWDQK